MGAVAAGVAGTVVGGLIQSQGAKSAANTQAAAMDRAGERTAAAAREAKAEILDRITPALKEYNQGILQSIDALKTGESDVISILNQSTGKAGEILAQTGADAQKLMLGSRAAARGIPRQQFERQYREASKLPPDQRGQALEKINQQILTDRPMGYEGAIDATQLGGLQAGAQLERGFGAAGQQLEAGLESATGRLGAAQDIIDDLGGQALTKLDPYQTAGQSALEQEAALSGALGPEAQQAALDSFIESPGQKYLREQQEKALLRSSAAIGGLGGGQVRSALQEQAMGIAATQQQQHLANLRSLAGRGQQAAGGQVDILSNIAAGKTGLLSQEAQMQLQTAQLQADLSRALGVSQADLSRMTAGDIAGLAERAGINMSQLAQQRGLTEAQLVQGLGGQVAGVKAGTAQDVSNLIQTGAAGQLSGQQNIAQLIANLATQQGSNLANIAIGKGQALSQGQIASSQAMGDMFQGIGNIAAYGLEKNQPQPQPPPTGGGGSLAAYAQ